MKLYCLSQRWVPLALHPSALTQKEEKVDVARTLYYKFSIPDQFMMTAGVPMLNTSVHYLKVYAPLSKLIK